MVHTTKIVKYLVLTINVLFALSGMSLLGIGITYLVDVDSCRESIPDDYEYIKIVPIFAIPISCLIVAIAGFGFWSVIKESISLTAVYAGVLCVPFFAQMALGLLAIFEVKDKDILKDEIIIKLILTFAGYNLNDKFRDNANNLQERLKCCGITGPESWERTLQGIPYSCCKEDICTTSNSFQKNCPDALFDVLYYSSMNIGIMALCFSILEIMGSLLSIHLITFWRIKSKIMNGE